MVLDLSAIRNSMYLHWKFAIRSLLFASRYGSRFIRNQKFDVFGSLLSGLCYSLVVMVLDLSAIRNSMYLHWKFAIRSLLFASRYGSRFIRNQKFDVFALEVCYQVSVIR